MDGQSLYIFYPKNNLIENRKVKVKETETGMDEESVKRSMDVV